jgi:hypothetical protein
MMDTMEKKNCGTNLEVIAKQSTHQNSAYSASAKLNNTVITQFIFLDKALVFQTMLSCVLVFVEVGCIYELDEGGILWGL